MSEEQIQNQDNNGNATDNSEKMIPKSRFDQVNTAKKQAEETLQSLVEELKEDIPEKFRELVPNLPPADQVKWIRTASKAGMFTEKAEPNGPDSKRPGGKPSVDFSTMSPMEQITLGLNQAAERK
ncbi:hypothetical protein [Fundidesulfovibrio putealis]|uniref:hypothetical protein n=1 Tax=Fundidesulfovibrio putealis TaxID=270496 RepID=UPI00040E0174|nr:hypothetical protein [Fundidesulfovibrio putealis]